MTKQPLNYTEPSDYIIWSNNFNSFDELKSFCDQFEDPSEDIALSQWLKAAQQLNLINALKGKRPKLNKRWNTKEWRRIVEDWSKETAKEQSVSEFAFVVAAVKSGFAIHMPYPGTRNKLLFNYHLNLPTKTAIDKALPKKQKEEKK